MRRTSSSSSSGISRTAYTRKTRTVFGEVSAVGEATRRTLSARQQSGQPVTDRLALQNSGRNWSTTARAPNRKSEPCESSCASRHTTQSERNLARNPRQRSAIAYAPPQQPEQYRAHGHQDEKYADFPVLTCSL